MKMKIAVFFGGQSVEHEVSIITGIQALLALDKEKYEPIPIYLPKNGGMFSGEKFFELKNYRDIPNLLKDGCEVSLHNSNKRVYLQNVSGKKLLGEKKPIELDAALPAVHGTFGEDGALSGLFEVLRLPYAGCDVLSGAVCMDKPFAKAILRAANLPVLNDITLDSESYIKNPEVMLNSVETQFPYPIMVKPANLGSSVGITKADNRTSLQAGLELAFSFAPRVLLESAIVHMREINCAVLGTPQNARASVCEEPLSSGAKFLSYRDKYQSGGKNKGMSSQKRIIPAEIPDEMRNEIQKLAVCAFKALGCSGVCRVDFLWDTLNDKIYINELNPIPGSLSFYLWGDVPFTKLLDELIETAFARQRQRKQLTFSHDVNILQNAEIKGKD